jgi:hypothetical protein
MPVLRCRYETAGSRRRSPLLRGPRVPGETDHRPIGCSTLVNSRPGWRELSMPCLRITRWCVRCTLDERARSYQIAHAGLPDSLKGYLFGGW